jgi:hypothetical protein
LVVAAEEVGDCAEEDGVGELYVLGDVLLEQVDDKLAELTLLKFVLSLPNLFLILFPILRLPPINGHPGPIHNLLIIILLLHIGRQRLLFPHLIPTLNNRIFLLWLWLGLLGLLLWLLVLL